MRLPALKGGVSVGVAWFDRSLVRKEIYYTVWFNTKCSNALLSISRGKPRGIKPDMRIKALVKLQFCKSNL